MNVAEVGDSTGLAARLRPPQQHGSSIILTEHNARTDPNSVKLLRLCQQCHYAPHTSNNAVRFVQEVICGSNCLGTALISARSQSRRRSSESAPSDQLALPRLIGRNCRFLAQFRRHCRSKDPAGLGVLSLLQLASPAVRSQLDAGTHCRATHQGLCSSCKDRPACWKAPGLPCS